MTTSTPSPRPSSLRKRAALLEAAEQVFLREGFERASMDEIAARAGVSKQTAYNHFGSKDELFEAMITELTGDAGDSLGAGLVEPADRDGVAELLTAWALRLLDAVLEPRIVALRRLVIGDATRRPELARAFYDGGPRRAIADLAAHLARLDERGLLVVDDAVQAASTFNWLVLAEPLNAAMFLGDDVRPSRSARERRATRAVSVFLGGAARC